MKVGIITFHASHNYGSMLQSYAMQQTVMAMGHKCEIINFRTHRQIERYRPFYRDNRIMSKLKALRYPTLALADLGKYQKFEAFLRKELTLSANQYSNLQELEEASFDYDAVICGSDQIWNTTCFDYDTAYLLPFVGQARKISYAPSMGPCNTSEMSQHSIESFRSLLPRFDYLSVRENQSSQVIEKLCGKKPEVVVDPTLLLNSTDWEPLCGSDRLIEGDYIFFYSPWDNIEKYNEAIALSSDLQIKLVVSMPYWYHQFHRNPNVEYYVDCGPREFLNLIKYSRIVVGASFHAIAFSIIYGKQFYAIDGMSDNRVSTLLQQLSVEQFANRPDSFLPNIELELVYQRVRQKLSKMIKESKAYLDKSLSQ